MARAAPSEADHAVEPVVVSDGERAEAQPPCLGRHLLWLTRAVEEAEGSVGVQLRVVRYLHGVLGLLISQVSHK